MRDGFEFHFQIAKEKEVTSINLTARGKLKNVTASVAVRTIFNVD
jgi:hypothetical protein